ncbi:MAG: hypothetical protein Q9226_008994 [Calogaya cf. arnoldii]
MEQKTQASQEVIVRIICQEVLLVESIMVAQQGKEKAVEGRFTAEAAARTRGRMEIRQGERIEGISIGGSCGHSRYMVYEEKVYAIVDGVSQSESSDLHNQQKVTEPFLVDKDFNHVSREVYYGESFWHVDESKALTFVEKMTPETRTLIVILAILESVEVPSFDGLQDRAADAIMYRHSQVSAQEP